MSETRTSTRPKVRSQLVVFLFADLVDSVALARQLGDAGYFETVLEPHNRIFRGLLAEYPGADEVKHTGDGFLATFKSASDAVEFSLRFHHALRTESWQSVTPRARVGIHFGEAVEVGGNAEEDRDLYGDAANVAARIMGLAEPGQTLLSRPTFDSARQSGRVRLDWLESEPNADAPPIEWLDHGAYRMKGADDAIDVCEVGLEGFSPLSPPSTSEKAKSVLSEEEAELRGWRPSGGAPIPHRPDWVLERPLGTGGFGEVWLAYHSRIRARRALKFCFDADRLRSLKRELTFFRLIRDHLGDRRDIGRLYEVHLDRPPFFLEGEYVAAGNLKQWAERQGGLASLPLDQRLRLLVDIAEAVAAAHSLGIIHKDLKPSNVLIDDSGKELQPKLVDFGIGVLRDRAILQQHEITEAGFTESLGDENSSSQTGTRMYQPPEAQLRHPPSTAGDVYALGVILYQLVAGDLGRPLGTGWEDDIKDELLREDIRECTHRDPNQRIASAAELAERLASLPARRQTRTNQLRAARQARRLRQVTAGLAVTVLSLALVGGLAAFSYSQWQRAERSRVAAEGAQRAADEARELEEESRKKADVAAALAQREATTASEISRFMVELFESSTPLDAGGFRFGPTKRSRELANLTARELLDRGATRIRDELSDQPAVMATLLDRMGRVYVGLGATEQADPLLRESYAIRKELYGDDHLEVAASAASLSALGFINQEFEQAERFARDALTIYQDQLPPDDPRVIEAMTSLAMVLTLTALDLREALDMWEQIVAYRREDPESGSLDLAFALVAQAWTSLEFTQEVTVQQGQWTLEAIERFKKVDETKPFAEALFHVMQGGAMQHVSNTEAAGTHFLQAISAIRETFGDEHPVTAYLVNYSVEPLIEVGRHTELKAMLNELLVARRSADVAFGVHDIDLLRALASVMAAAGDADEAEALYGQAIAAAREPRPDGSTWTLELAKGLLGLGRVFIFQERFDEAVALLDEAATLRRELWTTRISHASDLVITLNELARALEHGDQLSEATTILREAMTVSESALETDRHIEDVKLDTLLQLAEVENRLGDYEEAATVARDAVTIAKELEKNATEAISISGDEASDFAWRRAAAESILGDCMTNLGDFDDAESKLQHSYDELRRLDEVPSKWIRATLERLHRLYLATNDEAKAKEIQSALENAGEDASPPPADD